jgi:hypothetical protein
VRHFVEKSECIGITKKFSSWTCNSFSNCMLDMQFA